MPNAMKILSMLSIAAAFVIGASPRLTEASQPDLDQSYETQAITASISQLGLSAAPDGEGGGLTNSLEPAFYLALDYGRKSIKFRTKTDAKNTPGITTPTRSAK